MKNLLLLLLLFSFCGFSQTTKEKEMQKTKEKEMQNMYLSFLKEEGFKGKVSNLGNIVFKKEGEEFFIRVSDDELYFEVTSYLNNEKDGCSNKVKRMINKANGKYKSLKVGTIGDDCNTIKIYSSSLLGNKKDFEGIFYRSLNIVGYGEEHVLKLYREE
jgi:hypothetical protein